LVARDGDKGRQYIGIGGMPGIGLLLDLERIPRAAGGVQGDGVDMGEARILRRQLDRLLQESYRQITVTLCREKLFSAA